MESQSKRAHTDSAEQPAMGRPNDSLSSIFTEEYLKNSYKEFFTLEALEALVNILESEGAPVSPIIVKVLEEKRKSST